jgi:hypothetical protein
LHVVKSHTKHAAGFMAASWNSYSITECTVPADVPLCPPRCLAYAKVKHKSRHSTLQHQQHSATAQRALSTAVPPQQHTSHTRGEQAIHMLSTNRSSPNSPLPVQPSLPYNTHDTHTHTHTHTHLMYKSKQHVCVSSSSLAHQLIL